MTDAASLVCREGLSLPSSIRMKQYIRSENNIDLIFCFHPPEESTYPRGMTGRCCIQVDREAGHEGVGPEEADPEVVALLVAVEM